MKIALCSSVVPFIFGGARSIVEWVQIMLEREGHHVERVYLPEYDDPDLLMRQMAAFRWVDLSMADRIICFRPQAHLIPHPHKIVWFIHHIRTFYDLWDSTYRHFPDDVKHRGIRDVLRDADTKALQEAKHIFSLSQVVAKRLKDYNNIDSEVLYHPLYKPERFHCRKHNDEIVCITRLEHHKRQHLLIEAMAHTQTPVRLRLCGVSDNAPYVKELSQLISSLKLQKRVILENRWISEEEKVDFLADCLATAYLPVDEDSYGYTSLEASHSSKAILTTSDSGGVTELVQNGLNGFVTEPAPKALGKAMDALYRNRQQTKTMGEKAQLRLSELNISWARVLERLLA